MQGCAQTKGEWGASAWIDPILAEHEQGGREDSPAVQYMVLKLKLKEDVEEPANGTR